MLETQRINQSLHLIGPLKQLLALSAGYLLRQPSTI
jgi:hypothetical protein